MRTLIAVGLTIVLAVFAVACGDDGDGTPSDPTAGGPGTTPEEANPVVGTYVFDDKRTLASRETETEGNPAPEAEPEADAAPFAGFRLRLEPDGTFQLGVNAGLEGQDQLTLEGTWEQVGEQVHIVTKKVNGEPADEKTAATVDVYDIEPGYLARPEKEFVVYLRRLPDPSAEVPADAGG